MSTKDGVVIMRTSILAATISLFLGANTAAAHQGADLAYKVPLGRPVRWASAETNHRGSVTALEEIRQADGRKCRRIEIVVQELAGQVLSQAGGKSCRNASGQWRAIEWHYTTD
jgi:surface antigen